MSTPDDLRKWTHVFVALGGVWAVVVAVRLVRVAKGSGEARKKTPTLSCKFTGEERQVRCADADAETCAAIDKNVLCRDRYLDVVVGRINNWKKDNVWDARHGKVTWFDVQDATPAEHDGKACLRANMGASVWLCPGPDGTRPASAGYGRMVDYAQGFVSDDLVLEVLEAFEAERAAQERHLRQLAATGSDAAAASAWMAAHADIAPAASTPVLLLAGLSPSQVASDREAAKRAEADEEARKRAEAATAATVTEQDAPPRAPQVKGAPIPEPFRGAWALGSSDGDVKYTLKADRILYADSGCKATHRPESVSFNGKEAVMYFPLGAMILRFDASGSLRIDTTNDRTSVPRGKNKKMCIMSSGSFVRTQAPGRH